jgi:hypothetical protein
MKRLIYTAAQGWYRSFAPLFKWCCNHAYPEADVQVEIISGIRPPFYAACARFLQAPSQEYDEVYVGDIDMFHMPQSPGLFEYHEERMRKTGLCYSNTPRSAKEPCGPDRMTGLHFATQEWYARTSVARVSALRRLNDGDLGNDRLEDELMLMQICKDSGLQIPPREKLLPRHFGIHGGTVRCYENHTRSTRESQLRMRISPEMATAWNEMVDMPGFQEAAIESCVMSKRVGFQLEQIEQFTRKTSPVKTGRYFLKYL